MNKPPLCPEPRHFYWKNDAGVILSSCLVYSSALSSVFVRALSRFQTSFDSYFEPPVSASLEDISARCCPPAVCFQIGDADFRKQEYRIVAEETGLRVLGGSEAA